MFRQQQPCICKGNGLAMSSLYPEMRFSWEIKSVDALFCNGLTRLSDLSKEAILQAIKDGDLRFLQVRRAKIEIIKSAMHQNPSHGGKVLCYAKNDLLKFFSHSSSWRANE